MNATYILEDKLKYFMNYIIPSSPSRDGIEPNFPGNMFFSIHFSFSIFPFLIRGKLYADPDPQP